MRCPNEKCRREIPLDATEHKVCGWRASSTPPPQREAHARPHERHDECKAHTAGCADIHESDTGPCLEGGLCKRLVRDPAPDPEARAAAQERIRAMFAATMARPIPDPLTRWKRILEDPNACLFARESAQAAVAQLERRAEAEKRIRAEAERQARARAIVERQRADEERERKAEQLYLREKRSARPPPQRDVEAPPPAPRVSAPAAEGLPLGLAKDALEAQFDAERSEGAAARPANPRAAAPRYVSRGTSGASQRPKRSGQARASRR